MKKTLYICIAIIFASFSFANTALAQESAEIKKTRVVEDGGTGAYKAIMYTDDSLPTHTVFGPKIFQ